MSKVKIEIIYDYEMSEENINALLAQIAAQTDEGDENYTIEGAPKIIVNDKIWRD